jgi:pimeloyl-ACP methyl ester carboxylesterase/predicted glycosyltransferase
MRAREPDEDGFVERDGVKVFYERFGDGATTVLLLPTWSIVHSRHWKAQVPYLSRQNRVITFDGRGNGRSDRPAEPEAYADEEFVADAVAVLDALGVERVVVVGFSAGAVWAIRLAADHPERVLAAALIGPAVPFVALPHPERTIFEFDDVLETDEGWAKFNRHYWQRDYRGFLEFFMGKVVTEAHSTKPIEDLVGWGLETDASTLAATADAPGVTSVEEVDRICASVLCPVLVLHGDQDAISPVGRGVGVAARTNAALVELVGSGHAPHSRDPVRVNLLLAEFIASVAPAHRPRRVWQRARSRPKRVLYVSSPIGLGHAQRDLAIAHELRLQHPDLEIDWLAQHPVTTVLAAADERIHPASQFLVSESAHIESESAEHDLHAFQAIRRMDEILVNNFMVFHDLVQDNPYDLWIGDEAWDIDYFLHENPELKHTSFVWMTDFVGWLPMGDGGEHEAFLTADYNAEMIEQIARFKRVRDRAIFVGGPDDIVPDSFGPDLPLIREWTERNFDFAGYVTGFDPNAFSDRDALRHELGYGADERVCIVTVGGSGVGGALLRKVIAAYPHARRLVEDLRMVVVAGPRIDSRALPTHPGLEIRAYVPDLYRHLAACDIAIVQGGLTTCMELTANRRPFLFFPLAHHFEQNFHVRHRLDRYHAGRYMDYATSTPEDIALALHDELSRAIDYRPVETDGAERAAGLIAELL